MVNSVGGSVLSKVKKAKTLTKNATPIMLMNNFCLFDFVKAKYNRNKLPTTSKSMNNP